MKMMKKLSLIILALLMMSPLLCAQSLRKASAAESRKMVNTINRRIAGLRQITASFVQESNLSFMDDKAISKGSMSYSVKDGLTWQYLTPYQFELSIHKDKVVTKSGSHTQHIDLKSNKMFSNIATMMMNCVSGKSLTSGNEFKVAMYTGKSYWVAYLYPVKADFKKMFKVIHLHFNLQKSLVDKVELLQSNGDSIVISLYDLKALSRL